MGRIGSVALWVELYSQIWLAAVVGGPEHCLPRNIFNTAVKFDQLLSTVSNNNRTFTSLSRCVSVILTVYEKLCLVLKGQTRSDYTRLHPGASIPIYRWRQMRQEQCWGAILLKV